ncbi:MAG: hypothetical protein GY758_01065 [Fuerstiella sp.]|nr:hypothetical protein [Fuerstiella sp.]
MPDETKPYPTRVRERFAAGQSLDYIIAVNHGEVAEPDKARLDSCWKAVNKCVADLPTTVVNYESDLPPEYHVHYPAED